MVLADFGSVPNRLAGEFIEGDDVRRLSGTAMDDQQVLVEHRGGGRSENMCQLAEVATPDDLAGKIAGDDSRRIEAGIHQLAVRGRRPGAKRVVAMERFGVRVGNLVSPQFLSGSAIEAQQAANLSAVDR